MRVCAIIPARQWSMGTPGKNRAHYRATVLTAAAVGANPIIVTTDDPLLLRMSDAPIVHVVRPKHLEDGPTGPVVQHALGETEADVVVVLQPSSPTRNRALYVKAAIDMLARDDGATSVVSVVPWAYEPPQKAVYLLSGGLLDIPENVRRQDCQRAYRRDGTVYAVRANFARQGDLYGHWPLPLLVTPEDSVTID